MCEATTVLLGISTAVGAYSAYEAAGARADQAEAEGEARLRAAAEAEAQGQLRESQNVTRLSRLRGQQRAALAANGIDLGPGGPGRDTPRALLEGTASIGAFENYLIREAARSNALALREGASFAFAGAAGAQAGGYLAAAGTALTGGAEVARVRARAREGEVPRASSGGRRARGG